MARYWLAAAKSDYDWDWEAATREWVGFLQEPPVNHTSLALCYRVLGRMDKARFHQANIDAQLPATGPELWCSLTGKYVEALCDEMVQGRRGKGEDPRFDEVIAGGRRIQQFDPESHVGYQIEAMGHLGKHDYPAVIDATRRGRLLYEIQDLHALAGYAYARMVDEQHANDILRELERLPYQQPYFTARIHAALGNREQALTWLEKACEDRSEFLVKPDFGYGALRLDEAWDNLRSESRFEEVLRRTGLNQWPR
jgi:tetratricopeptide (TPR) repeat protein